MPATAYGQPDDLTTPARSHWPTVIWLAARDYIRSGIPMSILLVLLAWAAALFYWPLLGYRP